MAKQKMSMDEAQARLQELAPAIADELGWEITTWDEPNRHVVRMKAPEGFLCFFNAGWSGGYDQVSIRADLPRDDKRQEVYLGYNIKAPKINVSLTRSAEAIANEVRRRILPEFLPLWEKGLKLLDEHSDYERVTEGNAKILAKILGVPFGEIKEGKFALYRSTKLPENLGDISVSGEECKVELRCTVEEAEIMFKAWLASR